MRPSFHSLTPEEQAQFGNGVGPYWMPDWMRQLITGAASWFFQTASWRHHDFGYAVGGDRYDRRRCDDKFLLAMLKDAVTQVGDLWLLKCYPAIVVAIIFYLAVRIGGQFGSFKYREQYASLDEVLSVPH
ncbi:hypothetical protein SAMN04488527_101249 [Aliiroseovarius crassostreae]|uniref:Uncharacterized protein n=1 Tax=Aliiroseovarius crassostreae TaxID=154981 RepID=A0A0P7IX66_9RHOB|nr:hypothetical protein [Aliiroseovarius crassostreae]KPN64248.1 hypothetical protein AKJ29_16570 [Aliiroseovarius crassostreae]SFU30906.1 hypothetical protein SAMN04488527_101249 [Aliiroseovarius crassostreae]